MSEAPQAPEIPKESSSIFTRILTEKASWVICMTTENFAVVMSIQPVGAWHMLLIPQDGNIKNFQSLPYPDSEIWNQLRTFIAVALFEHFEVESRRMESNILTAIYGTWLLHLHEHFAFFIKGNAILPEWSLLVSSIEDLQAEWDSLAPSFLKTFQKIQDIVWSYNALSEAEQKAFKPESNEFDPRKFLLLVGSGSEPVLQIHLNTRDS